MDNKKNREAIFVILVGAAVFFIIKGHQMDGEKKIPESIQRVISTIRPQPEDTSEITEVSATEVIAVPKLVLPAHAMVNTESVLLHPKTRKPLGKINQGTVVDAQKQKGDDVLIYINGVEGLLPFGNLTFRR